MPLYSYSRLNTYETCPLQYKLRYIDGIATEKEGIEAFMGSRVHETLEKLYSDLILSKMNSLEELLTFYNGQWDKNRHEEIIVTRNDMTEEDYRKAGEKAIKEYYSHYHPFDQAKTLWTEKIVHFDLKDESYRLQGVVDRLDRTKGGVYEIHDYKSSKNLPSQAKIDEDRQLALYQLAVQEAFPDAEKVELVWHYVLFDTELRSSRSEGQLDELISEYKQLIDEVERTKEFVPRESALCNWCYYWEYCPKKKHILQLEDFSEGERKLEQGYALVDKYVILKEQEKRLEVEVEDVKQQLIAYAKEKNVDTIRGARKKANVSIKTERSFPSKSKDKGAYESIKQLVVDADFWDEVSVLDLKMILKKLDNGDIPEELSRQLENFVVEDVKERIYLSELKEGEE